MEIINDLEECFNYYDTEKLGYIPDSLFRNILQNFGFHKSQPREIEMELLKTDPEFPNRNAVSLKFCQQVVAYHWFKGLKEPGKDAEAIECFKLFDKKETSKITEGNLREVMQKYLPFTATEVELQEFIKETDKSGMGCITFQDFKDLYLDDAR